MSLDGSGVKMDRVSEGEWSWVGVGLDGVRVILHTTITFIVVFASHISL